MMDSEPREEAPLMTAEIEQDVLAQMQEFAQAQMEKSDPRAQTYIKNVATGRLVRSEEELERLMASEAQLSYVKWHEAVHLSNTEAAAQARKQHDRNKARAARKTRKRNRK